MSKVILHFNGVIYRENKQWLFIGLSELIVIATEREGERVKKKHVTQGNANRGTAVVTNQRLDAINLPIQNSRGLSSSETLLFYFPDKSGNETTSDSDGQ